MEIHFIPDTTLLQVMKADLSSVSGFFEARDQRGRAPRWR